MDSAWIGLGTAVFSALWASGGQAALQRRVVGHELDLSEKLNDPVLKVEMRRQAEARATIYLARRHQSSSRWRWLLIRAGAIVTGIVLIGAGNAVIRAGGSTHWIGDILSLVAFALVGAGIGAMGDEIFRDSRAWIGATRLRYARERLAAISGHDAGADSLGEEGAALTSVDLVASLHSCGADGRWRSDGVAPSRCGNSALTGGRA
ncbi:BCD family MFS transporter [Nocardioides terrae]|uniref:BCD family MFS transporter n=1 Tax=Nocardioides terrae TaxID=574651 RepID=UPI00111413D0|nr:BCD family MFS transporter [Nocardioides terrae]